MHIYIINLKDSVNIIHWFVVNSFTLSLSVLLFSLPFCAKTNEDMDINAEKSNQNKKYSLEVSQNET